MVKVLTFSVRERDPLVNYNPIQPITVSDSSIGFHNVNFHLPTLLEEVKNLKKKERNQYKKQIQTFLATSSSFLMLSPLMSTAKATNITVPATNIPKSAEGMPPEIMDLLIGLLVIAVGAGVVLAAILLVSAGIGKMFRMKNASAWTVDILKGFTQILIAVPVVFVIYYVANLIFAGSGWFVNPFKQF